LYAVETTTSFRTTFGMPNRYLQGHSASQRIPHYIDLLQPQVLHQTCNAVSHRLKAQRTVNVRRVAMPLQLNRNYLTPLRQGIHVPAKHRDADHPTMHERLTLTVNLVIHLQPI
jgi:hypothetical protein